MSQFGHVWLVGAGPGDPSLVTEGGLEVLRRAEVVLYDRLATAELLEACPPEAKQIDVGKSPGSVGMSQEEINDALIEHARAGKRVVRLKGGDPFVFGRGGEELEALAEAGIEGTVLPGVTSAIGGVAAAGIPVTHRGVATSFTVVTGHEDPSKPMTQVRWAELATATDTLVVLMGVGRLQGIVKALIEGGRSGGTPSALIIEATTPFQRVIEAPLEEIVAVAEANEVHPPALFVVGEVVALRERIEPALLRPLAGQRVLITRTRRQASQLAKALRAEGAMSLLLPAITIQQRADPEMVHHVLTGLRRKAYKWVVFTSENAVDVFFDLLWKAEEDARLFAGTEIGAVGVATARSLASRGISADLVPERASGEEMAEALANLGIEGSQILVPRAERARPQLLQKLRDAGAEVEELTLYLAAPPDDPPADVLAAVRAGAVDVVTFTSSSTVRNLVALLDGELEGLRDAVVACIGPATAQAALEAGLVPNVVAEEASVDGLVAALRRYVRTQQFVSEAGQ